MLNTYTRLVLLTLSLAALSGCAVQQSSHVHSKHGGWFRLPANNVITVINNTPHVLSIMEDGKVIRKDLQPGDVFTDEVDTQLHQSELTLVVQGTDKSGALVGTRARVFQLQNYGRRAEIWPIASLTPLGQP